MPWKETRVMDERMRFVVAVEAGTEPMAAVCRRFGISRQHGYKWLARWQTEGAGGLADRSRAPLSHPQAVPAGLLEACLAVRRAHPTWGPVKVRAYLERQGGTGAPELAWPAASTIGALFDREGLTVRRKLRRRAPPGGPLFAADAANDVWTIDFKGWFRTGDGTRVDPLTLSDACSRYLLRCQAVARPDTEHVWPILDAALREYGLPLRLRSDNGPPFATTGAGGLSRMAVNVIKAGVTPERIRPGKPQENGRHERLHRTLLADAATPPAGTRRAQQLRFAAFRASYNEERPHAALDNATPAERYAPSPRRWDGVLRSPEPAAGSIVRRVRRNGDIKWQGGTLYLSLALVGEPVALEEAADGSWIVTYGPVPLGSIARRGNCLKPLRRADGPVDDARRRPRVPQPQQPPNPET